jgi:succinate dehydrogenase / fumarate reductase iron-sulfur subunit
MTGQEQTIQARVHIQRYNPDVDKKPHLQTFDVPVPQGMTILDALAYIKAELDGSVTFRRSCRHAICGSCAMNVNGKNMLACNTPLRSVLTKKNEVTIRPLPFQPIIKDLVVDRSAFWEQYLKVRPWLIPSENGGPKEYRVTPEEIKALNRAETCIMCGACYASCQVVAMNRQYIGPHALLKAFLRVLDPRDSAPAERLEGVSGNDGIFRCHTIFNCIDACPKNLNPTEAIETLRKLTQRRLAFEKERAERQETL